MHEAIIWLVISLAFRMSSLRPMYYASFVCYYFIPLSRFPFSILSWLCFFVVYGNWVLISRVFSKILVSQRFMSKLKNYPKINRNFHGVGCVLCFCHPVIAQNALRGSFNFSVIFESEHISYNRGQKMHGFTAKSFGFF